MARGGAAVAVLDRVVEARDVGAAQVRVGGEGDDAHAQADRAARRVETPVTLTRAVALGVGVVGQEVGRVDDDVGVLGARGRVVAVVTGSSLTQFTLTVTVPVSVPPLPSLDRVVEAALAVAALVGVGREGDRVAVEQRHDAARWRS